VRRCHVSTLPDIGSRVRVSWGLGTAEGEVINAYDSGIGGQVEVAVQIEHTDQTMAITFSVDLVELAELA
jgi:hypothetical protein